MASNNFSATLSAPSGLALSTTYQMRSGAVLTLNGSNQLVVTSENDMEALLAAGWSIVTKSQTSA
jgi:hypothetical protein